jgi:hypothetical protein
MTDDFIVNLENYIRWEHKYGREAWCDPDDVQAALDEIERLRAALREIAKHDTDADGNWGFFRDEADAALEGEKKDD